MWAGIYVKRPFEISVCKGYYEVGVAHNDGLTGIADTDLLWWPPLPPTIQLHVAVADSTVIDITYITVTFKT